MLASKRGADDITQFSNKNRRTSGFDLPGNNQDIWSQMNEEVASNLSGSVVLFVLTCGSTKHQFTGIAIECRSNVTKFVTSGCLVRALKLYCLETKLEVHYKGNVVGAHLEEYDSCRQLAVVKVNSSLDVYCVCLNHGMEFIPRNENVAAIGHDLLGNLIVTTGLISYDEDEDEGCLVFFDADKCSEKNWLGAAFFDYDGNFVGMNHFNLLSPRIILEQSTSMQRLAFRYVGMNGWFETISGEHCFHPKAYDFVDMEKVRAPEYGFVNKEQLQNLGYPIPSRSMVNGGWVLLKTFEDKFGSVYPEGVWEAFKGRVPSEISRSVVALASFNGKARFFACSGVFVDFDDGCPCILTSASLVRDRYVHYKIVEGLRIEVALANKQHVDGTLLHYSLHYNVALVSVKNQYCRARYPVNLKHAIPIDLDERIDTKVVAVGRIFESNTLMATSGIITADTDNLSCKVLSYSTCEVTKAGIGGPLFDVNGNYIGMNFVVLNKEIGTAFLYRERLRGILEYFKTKNTTYLKASGSKAVVIEDSQRPINIWRVPVPMWYHPSELQDHMNDKREDRANGLLTRYMNGKLMVLK